MKSMTMENMMEANGGKLRIYTMYRCKKCGTSLGTKWAIKLHCKRKHKNSDLWETVYVPYYL